ncbi:MAG TPA: carboxypeptidase-like regulatory domain-containing protein, partial [Terriglobia bacterium]|nr:carboxypeptidase-like regulatory domain-containing protein [Terriglobia bacterium]
MMAFSAPVAGQIPVTQSGVVEGRVFARDGKPVAGARVGIMVIPEANAAEGAGALLSLSQTDDDGRYRLENVPPGNYFLVAGPVDVPVYFPGVRKAAEAVPVVVSGSAVVRDRDFHLTSPLTLRLQGRVVGEGKNGVTHVMLLSRTVGPSSPPPPPVVITPDGTFEFPRVQPGRYEVRVMPVKDLAAVTVVLDESDINDLQLAVPRSAISDMPITIKVAIAGDAPAPRFALQFQTSDMRNVRTMLVGLPEGTSRIPLGEYSVKTMPQGVSALPFGYSIKSMMSSDGKDLRNQPLVVGLDSRAEISIALEASPAAWIRVSGRVTGLAEVAPPHEVATIQLLGTSVAFPITATVNPDGSFEIPKVLPGTYEVRLTPAADPYPRALVVGSRDLTNVEIPVKLGAFKVEGRVADLKELLQEGVLTLNKRLTVTLMPEPAGPHISGRVANDGGFFMSQVPAGTYRISIGICEFDDCISTGGIAINVVDRDLAGLAVPSGRSRAGTLISPPPCCADAGRAHDYGNGRLAHQCRQRHARWSRRDAGRLSRAPVSPALHRWCSDAYDRG